MKPVCEVMVQQVFPSVRAVISRELIYEYKLNQNEVAKLLGVSQPAISQYIRQLRGEKKALLENEKVVREVKRICEKIHDEKIGRIELMNEFCALCKTMTSNGLICKMHKNIYNISGCNSCSNGSCQK